MADLPTTSHYHEFQVKIEEKDHPITREIEDFKITDELYVLDRAPEGAHILATALWEDKAQPLLYTKSGGKGKVLYNALGTTKPLMIILYSKRW